MVFCFSGTTTHLSSPHLIYRTFWVQLSLSMLSEKGSDSDIVGLNISKRLTMLKVGANLHLMLFSMPSSLLYLIYQAFGV